MSGLPDLLCLPLQASRIKVIVEWSVIACAIAALQMMGWGLWSLLAVLPGYFLRGPAFDGNRASGTLYLRGKEFALANAQVAQSAVAQVIAAPFAESELGAIPPLQELTELRRFAGLWSLSSAETSLLIWPDQLDQTAARQFRVWCFHTAPRSLAETESVAEK